MNIEIKLDFLKRVLTDTVEDDAIVSQFFSSDIFPDEKKMKAIM